MEEVGKFDASKIRRTCFALTRKVENGHDNYLDCRQQDLVAGPRTDQLLVFNQKSAVTRIRIYCVASMFMIDSNQRWNSPNSTFGAQDGDLQRQNDVFIALHYCPSTVLQLEVYMA